MSDYGQRMLGAPSRIGHEFPLHNERRVSVDNLSSLPPRYVDTGRHRERLDKRKFSLDSRSTSESGWSDRTPVNARLDRDVRYRGPPRENERMRNQSREEPPSKDEKSNEQTQNQGASGQKETQKEEEEEEQLEFDVAQIVPKEREGAAEDFEQIVKFLRLFIFALLFGLLLICVTTSAASFLLLESAIMKDHVHRWNAQSQLLYIICFPQVVGLVQCCVKSIFGNYHWPTKATLIFVITLEAIHAFGLALLVFNVLPQFGAFYAIGIMNSVAIVPGLSKIFLTSGKGHWWANCSLKLVDGLAVCIQFSALIVPFVLDLEDTKYIRQEKSTSLKCALPISLILISVKWWDNFVNCSRLGMDLTNLKKTLHLTRTTCGIFTSLVNMVVVIGSVYIFEWQFAYKKDYTHYFKTKIPKYEEWNSEDNHNGTEFGNGTEMTHTREECNDGCADDYFNSLVPGFVCVLGALLAYYSAGLAVKLKMQRFSFSLPLLISSPLVMGVIAMQCYDIIPTLKTGRLTFEYNCHGSLIVHLVHPILCWLSFAWLTRHIWFPDIERLANRDRIFVTKMYSGPLIIQSLMMSRRHDQLDKKSFLSNINEDGSDYTKSQSTKSTPLETKKTNRVPTKIYACGTMWHETKNEMIQLLKSIMRMDIDQNSRKLAEEFFKIMDPDYYEFEAHIFFDDCMDIDEDDKWIPNKYVIQFINCIDEAASSVHKEAMKVPPPTKTVAPYGGKLTWKLPCGNVLIAHLKDKHKIRHRKRWSQVMYMYFLLGYKYFMEPIDEAEKMVKENTPDKESEEKEAKESSVKKKSKNNKPAHYGKGEIFNEMTDETLYQLENTFILALDGDVDFKPDAVQMLVDRMKVNSHTGAACGRIHPIGSGPLVWYQVFEYAIGHWFQKATEHVLGCVLCSPGCFSLFRGSALLDDNVMKRYTTEPTEPSHYVQYDQGEDRWLCTLLLQQGYRVDYCAASDALTYAPESFDEFFNQRRRWTPSTIANIIDLLSDAKSTVQMNPNISFFYIMYQFLLVVAMVLGPATIILAIATAFQSVFKLTLWESYVLSLAPVIFYLVICFKCKTKTQLTVASFLSALYALVMVVVLVGIIQTIVKQSILNPSLLFLAVCCVSFVFSGLIHPYEFTCLIHGILYFLCIPAGYLLLIIYSISNLNVVSWGTREVPKRKTKAEMQREKELAEKKKLEKASKKSGIVSYLRLDGFLKDLKETITQAFSSNKENKEQSTNRLLRQLLTEFRKMRLGRDYHDTDFIDTEPTPTRESNPIVPDEQPQRPIPEAEEIKPDDAKDPNFIKYEGLGDGPFEKMSNKETKFFEDLIKKYLKPLPKDKAKEKQLAQDLAALRNQASFGFWFANLVWILFNYMINRDNQLNTIEVYGFETQPLGFVFIIFFMAVLLLQMIGMIMHRWLTFIQLISITEVSSPVHERISVKEAIKVARDVQKQETIFDDGQSFDDAPEYTQYGDIPCRNPDNLVHNVKHKLRRPDDVAIDIDRLPREEPIDKAIERKRREHWERKRHPRYNDTVRSRIRDHYGRRARDLYRGDERGNYGRLERGISRHGRYEDINMRARKRLEALSRANSRHARY